MFQDFTEKLVRELQEGDPNGAAVPKIGAQYAFEVDGIDIVLTDASPNLGLYCAIGPAPQDDALALFTALLRGNFMGQATHGACLGLNESGDQMVLSQEASALGNYRLFKDTVEDFINTACFWKKQSEEKLKLD